MVASWVCGFLPVIDVLAQQPALHRSVELLVVDRLEIRPPGVLFLAPASEFRFRLFVLSQQRYSGVLCSMCSFHPASLCFRLDGCGLCEFVLIPFFFLLNTRNLAWRSAAVPVASVYPVCWLRQFVGLLRSTQHWGDSSDGSRCRYPDSLLYFLVHAT